LNWQLQVPASRVEDKMAELSEQQIVQAAKAMHEAGRVSIYF